MADRITGTRRPKSVAGRGDGPAGLVRRDLRHGETDRAVNPAAKSRAGTDPGLQELQPGAVSQLDGAGKLTGRRTSRQNKQQRGASDLRPPQRQCEFFLVRYMPDPVKEEFVNVGVALSTLDSAGPTFCDVLFTRSWSRAKCLDPDLDPEEIQGLEQQIRDALWNSTSGSIDSLRESCGGRVQLTTSKVILTESPEAELKLLQDAYLHRPSARSRDHAGARELLVNVMRGAFDREGILSLMTINVPISHYTQDGDPL